MKGKYNTESKIAGFSDNSVPAVTVAARLFYRQRALGYWLGSLVVTSALLFVSITQLRLGPANLVVGLAVVLFWSLPFAIGYLCRYAYVKPAKLSFTAQGFCLKTSDTQLQVAWEDLATYQVAFSLRKLVGAGYQLKLREVRGHTLTVNLLERQLLPPEGGLRPDSALAYLSRYIGWYNQQVAAAGVAAPIAYRPGLYYRKLGTVLLAMLGALLLVDFWVRWQHPAANGVSVGVLAGAFATGLLALGQKKREKRYAEYLLALQATGISAAEATP